MSGLFTILREVFTQHWDIITDNASRNLPDDAGINQTLLIYLNMRCRHLKTFGKIFHLALNRVLQHGMEKTSSRSLLPKDGEKTSSIIGKLLLFLYIFFKILYNFCYLCYYSTDSDPVDSRVAWKRSALSVRSVDQSLTGATIGAVRKHS